MGLEDVHDCSGWATGNRCGVCYVCRQTAVAKAVRRVLRDDGILWMNLGDKRIDKQLLGIPWRLALSLQADGWILRQDVIWHKPNTMPGSTKDRPLCTHEFIFLFSKEPKYYYDDVAIREKADPKSAKRYEYQFWGEGTSEAAGRGRIDKASNTPGMKNFDGFRTKRSVWKISVASERGKHFASYPEKLIMPCILAGTSSHGRCSKCYAPYKRLVERERVATRPGTDTKVTGDSAVEGNRDPERHVTHVKTIGWEATCSCESDKVLPCIVLDPFCGTGTTLAAAVRKNRWAIGFELNPEYVEMAHEKIQKAISTKGFGL